MDITTTDAGVAVLPDGPEYPLIIALGAYVTEWCIDPCSEEEPGVQHPDPFSEGHSPNALPIPG